VFLKAAKQIRAELITNSTLQRDDNSVGLRVSMTSRTFFLANIDLADWNSSIARPVKSKGNHQYWLILPAVI
jgi:hypothetical protein